MIFYPFEEISTSKTLDADYKNHYHLVGGGLGFEITKILPIPLVTINVLANYHTIRGFDTFKFMSWGVSGIASVELLPFITPFVEVGLANAAMKVLHVPLGLPPTPGDIDVKSSQITTAVGAEVLGMFILSMTISPKVSYSIAARINL